MEPPWGGLEGSWRHAGNYIEPYWVILSDIGGGFSGALLEPSWAIMGALTPRAPPVQVQGAGVGGWATPIPEGEGGFRKRELIRPLTP